jgi:hypothetical protein
MKEKDWILIILLASLGYAIYRNYNLKKELNGLKQQKKSLLAQMNVRVRQEKKPTSNNSIIKQTVPQEALGNIKKSAV